MGLQLKAPALALEAPLAETAIVVSPTAPDAAPKAKAKAKGKAKAKAKTAPTKVMPARAAKSVTKVKKTLKD